MIVNKTIKYNGAEVVVNWQSSSTRKKIVDIFGRTENECLNIKSKDDDDDAITDTIAEMEQIEQIYRGAFIELFGKEKTDELFPEDAGIDEYYEFIDLMIELEADQRAAMDKYTEKFNLIAEASGGK